MRAREKLLALSGCPESPPSDGWLISPVLRSLDEGWAGMPPVQLPSEAPPEVCVAWAKELEEKEDNGDGLGDVWHASANALVVSDDSGGSDSCPSDDNLAENERTAWEERLLAQEREVSLARSRRPKNLAARSLTAGRPRPEDLRRSASCGDLDVVAALLSAAGRAPGGAAGPVAPGAE